MRILIALISVLVLCGCKDIEGRYAPACVAFEGDIIELNDGRFTWNRFTDAVQIDDEGNKVDPFPGFPKSGDYVTDDMQIELHVDGGDPPKTYSMQAHDGKIYLLTAVQAERYSEEGVVERCALVRDDASKK